jgi:hypothetical protein
MSIFDMFKAPQAPTAPATVAETNNTVPSASNLPLLVDPANPTAPAKSAMDTYSTLWEPDAAPTAEALATAAQQNDPARFLEAAKQLNFSSIIPAETMAAITQGGEGATAAFAAAMNTVAQATYAQSAHATSKIVENALAAAEAKFASSIPDMIKKYQVSDTLRTENPALSHPSAAPIIGALNQQLAKKFPQASTAELKDMVSNYLTTFAAAVAPQPVAPAPSAKHGEVDWMALLGN